MERQTRDPYGPGRPGYGAGPFGPDDDDELGRSEWDPSRRVPGWTPPGRWGARTDAAGVGKATHGWLRREPVGHVVERAVRCVRVALLGFLYDDRRAEALDSIGLSRHRVGPQVGAASGATPGGSGTTRTGGRGALGALDGRGAAGEGTSGDRLKFDKGNPLVCTHSWFTCAAGCGAFTLQHDQ